MRPSSKRTVRDRTSSKNSSPCSPPRDRSAERILRTGRSESAAAFDKGPPRGFPGGEYIILFADLSLEGRMRTIAATGALALFLLSAPAGAFHGYANPMNAQIGARAYSHFLAGYLDFREGNLDAALESYTKALKYAGDEPDILYEIASVHVKKGRLPEARAALEKALAGDESHTRSRYLLAGILAASGDREKALAQYDRVLKEDPENEEAYLHLATLRAERGEFSRAEEVLGALIARDPDSFLGHHYRGRVLAAQKKFTEALADYDKALSTAPGFDAALLDSCAVLEILGRNAEAEERYRKALHVSPNNPLIRERLGRVLIREKKIDQAVGEYEELRKFSADNPDVRTKLGLLYLDRNRFDEAINEFNFVLASDPGNAHVRFFLGTAYEEKGAVKEAEEAFRKVPEDAPVHREAMLHLAMLLARQKKSGEAVRRGAGRGHGGDRQGAGKSRRVVLPRGDRGQAGEARQGDRRDGKGDRPRSEARHRAQLPRVHLRRPEHEVGRSGEPHRAGAADPPRGRVFHRQPRMGPLPAGRLPAGRGRVAPGAETCPRRPGHPRAPRGRPPGPGEGRGGGRPVREGDRQGAREAGRGGGEAPSTAQGGARREVNLPAPLRAVAPLLAALAFFGCSSVRILPAGAEAGRG